MTITRTNSFVPGTFLKCCAVCGFRFRANELRRGEDGFWRCTAYCLEVPSITRDKIATMAQKRKEAPPPPHGTPFDRGSTFANEAVIFNFLCEQPIKDANWPGGFRLGAAPQDYFDTTNGGIGAAAPVPQTDPLNSGATGYSVSSAGETCRYLYSVINDNKRPLRWIATAKAKLRELVDWMITKQRGFGTSPASTKTNDGLWGGIISQFGSGLYYAVDNAGAGLSMLHAFRVLGDAKYLVSAKASASFLRNMQAAPNPPYLGTLPVGLTTIGGIATQYYPTAMLALEMWNELLTTSGDALYGSDGTPAGFAVIPQQLLSQCIADIRGFWRTGVRDALLGVVVTGLSSAKLSEYLNQSGSAVWQRIDGPLATTGTLVTGRNIAMALRSLYAYEGYSTQVADVWTYLMALGSNALFQSAVNTLATDYTCALGTNSANPPPPPAGSGNVIAPSFNSKLALSNCINASVANNGEDYYWAVATAAGLSVQHRSTYDWTTFGLMAAIQSAKDQGNFKKAKEAACTTRYRMPITFVDLPVEETVLLRGSSGLAFQLSLYDDVNGNGDPSNRLVSATAAAMIGNAFRYAPQGYTGSAGPGNPYSQKAPGVQY